MSYTPTEWASGDIVTSQKLNKLENGVQAASESELPSVTAEDNGKVLGVTNGAWGKINVPSSGALIVNETGSEGEFSLDKTFAEMESAVLSGKTIIVNHVGRIYETFIELGVYPSLDGQSNTFCLSCLKQQYMSDSEDGVMIVHQK